jgi:hypothetical protein
LSASIRFGVGFSWLGGMESDFIFRVWVNGAAPSGRLGDKCLRSAPGAGHRDVADR